MRHSVGWFNALQRLGLSPSASDELMTSTHWLLYAKLFIPSDNTIFDTVICVELGSEDPRDRGTYDDMAKQVVRRLMAHLSREN